jgi:hypothetical protein
LAEAYSATLYEKKVRGDVGWEFAWVTTHPFDQTKWPEVHAYPAIEQALRANPEVLGDPDDKDFNIEDYLDTDLLRQVADRIWLLVISEKQDTLSLTQDELLDVWKVLNRKKGGSL